MLDELFREELVFHKSIMPDTFQIPDIEVSEKWLSSILNCNTDFLVVEELDTDIVGAILYMIMTNPDDAIFQERKSGYIQEMIVSESSRGKGLGKELLDFTINDLKTKNVFDVELNIWENNEIGLEFYKKYGFKTIQRRMRSNDKEQ